MACGLRSFHIHTILMGHAWLAESPKNMEVLKNYGYNVLHIVPAGELGYDFKQLDE